MIKEKAHTVPFEIMHDHFLRERFEPGADS
jgi:hypothetical protein